MEITIEEFLKTDYAQANVEDLKVLYDAIIKSEPYNLVEVGTGASTITIAIALRDICNKIVNSEVPTMQQQQFVSIDIDKKRQNETQVIINDYGLSSFVIIKNENSTQFLFQMLPTNSMDFAFIDSSHTFEQTLVEITLMIPSLKQKSFLFMHDTKLFSVLSAIYATLKIDKDLYFQEYNTPLGLGLIWKKEK